MEMSFYNTPPLPPRSADSMIGKGTEAVTPPEFRATAVNLGSFLKPIERAVAISRINWNRHPRLLNFRAPALSFLGIEFY
jgi:hypothetical protein